MYNSSTSSFEVTKNEKRKAKYQNLLSEKFRKRKEKKENYKLRTEHCNITITKTAFSRSARLTKALFVF